jgi:D-sedoheptulose 7-phosphate isomerase
MSKLATWISDYVTAYTQVLGALPVNQIEQLISRLQQALRDGRMIFVMGNGGSAATASHFVTDLGKGASDAIGKRFRCLSLNDNTAWMTAIGNDYAYDDIFIRQLENFARPGDVVMAISVSGNSPNIVNALTWAREHGCTTVAMVGAKRGRVASVTDQLLVIDSEHYGRVEDAHLTVCHLLCYAFMEKAMGA